MHVTYTHKMFIAFTSTVRTLVRVITRTIQSRYYRINIIPCHILYSYEIESRMQGSLMYLTPFSHDSRCVALSQTPFGAARTSQITHEWCMFVDSLPVCRMSLIFILEFSRLHRWGPTKTAQQQQQSNRELCDHHHFLTVRRARAINYNYVTCARRARVLASFMQSILLCTRARIITIHTARV